MPKFIGQDTKDLPAAFKSIAAELKRANDLKEIELKMLATTAKPYYTREKELVEKVSKGEF